MKILVVADCCYLIFLPQKICQDTLHRAERTKKGIEAFFLFSLTS